MGLEAFSFISQLVPTNPVNATDDIAQGDDHIRGIKQTLQNTFPNANAAINPTPAEFNRLVGVTAPVEEMRGMATASQGAPYAIAAGDIGKAVIVTGPGTVTLGALADGFACALLAANAFTLSSSSGALSWYTGGGIILTGNRAIGTGAVITVVRSGGAWIVFGAGIT